MNPNDENRLEQNVDRAVQALKSLPVPEGPPPDLLAAVLAAGKADTQPKTRSLKERIASMNRFLKIAAALSAAAVIVAASLVAFFVWTGGHSGGLAIADVLKSITAKTARFTITVKMEPQPAGMPPGQTMHVLVMEGRMRSELPGGVYQIMDLSALQNITVIPPQKKVMVMKMTGLPQGTKDQMSNDFFGELQRRIEELRGSGPKDVEWLDEKDINGRPARGFHKRVEGMDITVWADVETCLPVLMEIRYGGGAQQYFVTMSDFEFDVPLDPALFSMAVPDGYTVEERSMDISPPTEADLVAGLRQWANLADGAFPDRIDLNTIQEILKKWITQQSGNAQQSPTQEQLDTMQKVQRVLMFLMQLSAEKVDWRYAGKGVRLGDAGTPVFWYRPKGAANYRMVCGDLTVADVAPDALPDIPDAQRPDDGSASQPSPAAQAPPAPTPAPVQAPAPPPLPPRVPPRATPPAVPVPAPGR